MRIKMKDFLIGVITTFGGLAIAMLIADINIFLDILSMIIAMTTVPLGMIIACGVFSSDANVSGGVE